MSLGRMAPPTGCPLSTVSANCVSFVRPPPVPVTVMMNEPRDIVAGVLMVSLLV